MRNPKFKKTYAILVYGQFENLRTLSRSQNKQDDFRHDCVDLSINMLSNELDKIGQWLAYWKISHKHT